MIKVNVFFTNSKLILKNLILNEAKTFIIGKVQDKNNKLNYISTKWEINRETEICKCVLGDIAYDFSIKGVCVQGISPEVVKKNFYTFNKSAWHCKLYKWVYGKEPHKVHPTMCPYFWIMVVTLFPPVFGIILITKLFGKTGTAFMEKCSTYQSRKKARQEEIKRKKKLDWITKLKQSYKDLEGEAVDKLFNCPEWDSYRWEVGSDVRIHLSDTYSAWMTKQRELRVERQHVEYLKQQEIDSLRREKEQLKKKKVESKPVKLPKIKKDSKTAKIIGIGFISIAVSLGLWGLTVVLIHMFNAINWLWVGKGILIIIGIILGGLGIYLTIAYILVPLYIYVISPLFTKIIIPSVEWVYNKVIVPFYELVVVNTVNYCIVKPIKYGVIKPVSAGADKLSNVDFSPIERFFINVGKVFKYIGFLFTYPFIMMGKGFIYMVEFFKMCKDLMYNMYKKNCPVITWTANEEENNN